MLQGSLQAGWLPWSAQSLARGQFLKKTKFKANMPSPSMLDRNSVCAFVISLWWRSCRVARCVQWADWNAEMLAAQQAVRWN